MLQIILDNHCVNKIKNLSIALIASMLWNAHILKAQNFDHAPLFDFLQKTADSTIILSHLGIIDQYPDYYLGQQNRRYCKHVHLQVQKPGSTISHGDAAQSHE